MIINTEAIVLNSKKFGDTSKIVSLYSKEAGSISVIAKGSRKPNSKFGSSLEPLSYCSISYYDNTKTNLHLLSKSELYKPLRRLHDSFDHLQAGLLILESVIQTQEHKEKNPELFDIISGSLVELNELKPNPYSVFTAFQIRLAELMGFGLNFVDEYELFAGKNPEDQDFIISLEDASLSREGQMKSKNIFRMNGMIIRALSAISESGTGGSGDISLDEISKAKVTEFFAQYFSFHMEKKIIFRSFRIMDNGK